MENPFQMETLVGKPSIKWAMASMAMSVPKGSISSVALMTSRSGRAPFSGHRPRRAQGLGENLRGPESPKILSIDWFSREKLQENPIEIMGKSVVSCRFSHQLIH